MNIAENLDMCRELLLVSDFDKIPRCLKQMLSLQCLSESSREFCLLGQCCWRRKSKRALCWSQNFTKKNIRSDFDDYVFTVYKEHDPWQLAITVSLLDLSNKPCL